MKRNKTFKVFIDTISSTFNMAPFIKSHGNADSIITSIMGRFKEDANNKVEVFSECNTLNELMNIVIITCRSLIDIGGAYLFSIGRITIGTIYSCS